MLTFSEAIHEVSLESRIELELYSDPTAVGSSMNLQAEVMESGRARIK
jgi:hypothetical protein